MEETICDNIKSCHDAVSNDPPIICYDSKFGSYSITLNLRHPSLNMLVQLSEYFNLSLEINGTILMLSSCKSNVTVPCHPPSVHNQLLLPSHVQLTTTSDSNILNFKVTEAHDQSLTQQSTTTLSSNVHHSQVTEAMLVTIVVVIIGVTVPASMLLTLVLLWYKW